MLDALKDLSVDSQKKPRVFFPLENSNGSFLTSNLYFWLPRLVRCFCQKLSGLMMCAVWIAFPKWSCNTCFTHDDCGVWIEMWRWSWIKVWNWDARLSRGWLMDLCQGAPTPKDANISTDDDYTRTVIEWLANDSKAMVFRPLGMSTKNMKVKIWSLCWSRCRWGWEGEPWGWVWRCSSSSCPACQSPQRSQARARPRWKRNIRLVFRRKNMQCLTCENVFSCAQSWKYKGCKAPT